MKKIFFTSILVILTFKISAATLFISPFSMDFGQVELNNPLGRSSYFTIHNNGPEDVDLYTENYMCWGNFEVDDFSCRRVLRAYDMCQVRVTFRPRNEGYQRCDIEIRDYLNNANGFNRISVSGRGIK